MNQPVVGATSPAGGFHEIDHVSDLTAAMTDATRFSPAYDALDAAEEADRELHEGCCQPLRSPRMEHLARTIDAASDRLGEIGDDPKVALQVVDVLHDAGSAARIPAGRLLRSDTDEAVRHHPREPVEDAAIHHKNLRSRALTRPHAREARQPSSAG